MDIPAFRVKRGDTVALTEAMRANVQVQQCLGDEHLPQAPWLEVHREQASARVMALPDETSVPFPLQVQLVVEYYAQSV